jgi:NitT/TauT family transport system substrate-binding protein
MNQSVETSLGSRRALAWARHALWALSALCASAFAGQAAQAADHVNIAISNSTSDFAILIAMKNGYFAEEGIEANGIVFDSGGKMIAPLGSGDIDVATGSASATLFNAVARGIKIQIASGNGRATPGYGHQILIVRKQHVDSGRYKTMADLKGMKIALPGTGTGATSTLNEGLKTVGLSFKDIEPVYISYPNHVTAIANGAVDAGLTTEPAATFAVQKGIAVKITSNDTYYPNADATHIIFSANFAQKRPDVAKRFMRAFIKAMRFYDGALKDGGLHGPNAEKVIDILTQYTALKDRNIYRIMNTQGSNPDALLNRDSLKTDFEFYKSQGWIEGDVKIEDTVNTSFADAARKELGPYKRKE